MPDEFNLVVPFLDQSEAFANGCAFGMLYARMRQSTEVSDFVLLALQEQVTLTANRLGWTIDVMRQGDAEGWFWLEMHAPDGWPVE